MATRLRKKSWEEDKEERWTKDYLWPSRNPLPGFCASFSLVNYMLVSIFLPIFFPVACWQHEKFSPDIFPPATSAAQGTEHKLRIRRVGRGKRMRLEDAAAKDSTMCCTIAFLVARCHWCFSPPLLHISARHVAQYVGLHKEKEKGLEMVCTC